MEKQVVIPDIGDFDGVDVVEILVNVGDQVEMETPVITLESDKATMDVPSPYAGVIADIKVAVGDNVSQGTLIMTIEAEAADNNVVVEQNDETPVIAEPVIEVSHKQSPPVVPLAEVDEDAMMLAHAGPSVRRFARELGVDLGQVNGSGPKNRILQEDIQAFVKNALSSKSNASASSVGGVHVEPMPEIDFSLFGEIETQSLSRIKKLSGAFLHRNWVNIPHVTQFDEVDITDLEAFRKAHAEEAKQKGIRLTLLVFIMKAAVAALKAFPTFNASLDKTGENLIIKHYYHIGVAVDTPNGLVVPVIRDVDQKGLFDLAEELVDFSQRARDGKLSPSDMQGGCFTISSLGGIGGTAFTPIINAPEVAILGVSRSSMKPQYKNDEFVPRLMLPLSLSYDHRVIDGAEGARFSTYLGMLLTDVRRLLL